MKVTITEPCKISGADFSPGDQVDLEDNDAMAVVGAGRGTIDPARSADVIKRVEAAAKAVKAAKPQPSQISEQ
jgi:hypothetical protein